MKENNDISFVWIGILLTVFLVWTIIPLIVQENAFRRVEGEIVTSRIGNNFHYITLNTSRGVYRARLSRSDILREKAVVGKEAVIWYHITGSRNNPGRHYFIEKMIVDNEVVIPFRSGIGVRLFFIGVVLAFLIAIIFHFVKKGRKRVNEIEN